MDSPRRNDHDVIDMEVKPVSTPQAANDTEPSSASSSTFATSDPLAKLKQWWHQGGSVQDLTQTAKTTAADAGERAKAYVQKEPVKAVAIAAAAGMVVTAVMGARSRAKAERKNHG